MTETPQWVNVPVDAQNSDLYQACLALVENPKTLEELGVCSGKCNGQCG